MNTRIAVAFSSLSVVYLFSIVTIGVTPGAFAASPPQPTYGTAVVDGATTEWDASDYFADMYRAGNPTKPLESTAYLRYDCNTHTLYVLVLTVEGVPALAQGWESAAWSAIGDTSNKVYTGNSGNNGVPPDFAWVGLSEDGLTALGYEASFTIDPGTYTLIVHVEVYDAAASQTSATVGFPREGVPLEIVCAPHEDHPSIDLEKYVSVDGGQTWETADTLPGPTIVKGDSVYFKFVVTNSGNVDLTGITLTDTVYDTSGCTPPATLAAGESFECVIGPFAADAGQQMDTGTATGDFGGNTYTHSDDAYYLGVHPSISVTKYVSIDDGVTWEDANTPTGPLAIAGRDILFKIVITNGGDVTLTNIMLTDSVYDTSGCTLPASLAPGESHYCVIGPFPADVGQQKNKATASGDYGTKTFTNSDDAHYYGVVPGIDVKKYVSVDGGTHWEDANSAPGPYVLVGQGVLIKFVVTNIGDVDLTNVTLIDNVYDASGCTIPATLAVGQSFECVVGPFPAASGQQTDTATATGDFGGQTFTHMDSANFFGAEPSIDVTKYISVDGGATWLDANSAPGPYVLVGQSVLIKLVVTNTGNVELADISLTDTVYDTKDCVIPATLAAGASFECVIGPFPAGVGQQMDTATAHGHFDKNVYSDTDDAYYFGAAPSIDVKKYVSVNGGVTWTDANSAPGAIVLVGGNVLFKFVVTNTGNVTLTGITLDDNIYGASACTIPEMLTPGESFQCVIGPFPAIFGQQKDTATATGDFGGQTYTHSDNANYYGTLVTYTIGGYGGTGVPGRILTQYYASTFPTGLQVGQYYPANGRLAPNGLLWQATSTGLSALKKFFPGGGTSGAITTDELNPTKGSGGTLSRQAAALTISISFSGLVPSMPAGFGGLYYHNPGDSLDGKTVAQILSYANTALAGLGLPTGYTFGSLNALLTELNQAFDNGVPSVWAQTHLKST